MVYINDLGNVGFKGRVILYADDTNFLYCDRNAEELPMKKVRIRRSYTTHIRRVHIRKSVYEMYINQILHRI